MLKRISKAECAKQSVKIRKIYRIIRIVILIAFTLQVIPYLIINIGNIIGDGSNARIFTFLAVIGMIIVTYGSMSIPISSMTIDKFTSDEDYALYLRGFESDSYDIGTTISNTASLFDFSSLTGISQKPNPNDLPLSEELFCKNLRRYYPIYSIGMTKELESPHGSKRIYVDDETWKEDVAFLIKNAKYVFIKIHNSDSCIWEILQCEKEAAEKTIYFIDTLYEYNTMLKSMKDEIPAILRNHSDAIIDFGHQARNRVMDDQTKKEIDALKELYEKYKEKIIIDENYDLEDLFLDMKAKLHLVLFHDGSKDRLMNYDNTKEGFSNLTRTIFANKMS